MVILHGENQVESRKQLIAAKGEKSVVEFDSDASLDQLVTAVNSNSLFGETNTVVLEGVLSARPSNSQKAVIDYLLKHQDRDIIVWESKDVSVKTRDFDPKNVRKFDLPKYVFKFLDDLSLSSLQLALTSASAEQILALLAGHLHKLLMVKDAAGSGLPPWQAAKLKSQASHYTLTQLIDFNQQLLELDYHHKTSQLPYDLGTGLEVWVTKLHNKT